MRYSRSMGLAGAVLLAACSSDRITAPKALVSGDSSGVALYSAQIAAATELFFACHNPSGHVYRIQAEGAKDECASDAHTLFAWLANGIPGATGEKGDVGPAGAEGDEGPAGDPGAMGDQGEPGEKGEDGPTGDAGATGPDGDKGETGAAGATGDKGPDGDKGPEGFPGGIGDKGDKGPTGDQGFKGSDGAFVITGHDIVSRTIEMEPRENRVATVRCPLSPAGLKLVMGGVRKVSNSNGNIFGEFSINESYPQSEVTWHFTLSLGDVSQTSVIELFVICALVS